MPRPVPDALARRDEARWRTRRLSWLIAAGAAAATAALGTAFSQLLPGHSAAAAGGSRPPASTAPATAASGAQPGGGQGSQPAQSQPAAPAPAPTQAAPQVVSGGS